MARGENPARSPNVARKKRHDPAAEAESRLRHLHAVGRVALARFPVGAAIDPDTVHEIAEREGLRLDSKHLAGFELKKTVAVRYRDKALIDRLVVAASRVKVYDLIKVDYDVTDLGPIQERLAEAAAAVVKAKAARHERLLGIKLRAVPQVYAERSSAYFPTEMYGHLGHLEPILR